MSEFTLHKALSGALEIGAARNFNPGAVNVPELEKVLDLFRAAPKFSISDDALTMLEQIGSEGRRKMAGGMVEAGVFRLPFADLVMQTQMKGKDGRPKVAYLYMRHVPDTPGHIEATMIIQRDDRTVWSMLPVWWRAIPDDDVLHMETFAPPWFSDQAAIDATHKWLNTEGSARNELVAQAYTTLVLLMATRGIAREKRDPPPKLQKARAKARKEPLYSHTVLRIHPKLQHLAGKTYTSEGRVMPRLHWRIGHPRQQRHGPKLAEVKTVWIEGQLIGCDSAGIVTHDYVL